MVVKNSKRNYIYRAYGLYFSSNRPIPNLVQVEEHPELNARDYLDQPIQINFRGLQSWFPTTIPKVILFQIKIAS